MKQQFVLTGVEVLLAVGEYLSRKGLVVTPPNKRWRITGTVLVETTFSVEFIPADGEVRRKNQLRKKKRISC